MHIAVTNICRNFHCKTTTMKEVISVWMQTRIFSCAGAQLSTWQNEYSYVPAPEVLTRSIPGWWIGLTDFPSVPYRYVFRQLFSEVSQLHRTPLKSRQSAKIHTTVVWGACERKSRSSACCRSNVGLPICLYPSLMQSTVLQIFIKALNITFFPIKLYSLRFMIHVKTKPNNGLSASCVFMSFFLSICGLPTTSIFPDFMCK